MLLKLKGPEGLLLLLLKCVSEKERTLQRNKFSPFYIREYMLSSILYFEEWTSADFINFSWQIDMCFYISFLDFFLILILSTAAAVSFYRLPSENFLIFQIVYLVNMLPLQILEPSKEVALQLLEQGRQNFQIRKLGMDMLRQLSLHHDFVTVLLQDGYYLEALRYARKHKVLTLLYNHSYLVCLIIKTIYI